MNYCQIRNDVYTILRNARGRYRTAYQICQMIKSYNPNIWRMLVRTYPTKLGRPPYGHNAGTYYSPATFIAKALSYFKKTDAQNRQHISMKYFDSQNVKFSNIEAGFRGYWVSIWAWDPRGTQN